MENTIEQVEKNTQASFGYVKKDLLMVNDSIADLQEKIQHLSLNHMALLEEIKRLRLKVDGEKALKKPKPMKTAKKKSVKKKPAKKKVSKKAKPKKIVKETITYS